MILQMQNNIVWFFLTYCYIINAWRLCTDVEVLYVTCTLRYIILILAIIQNNMRIEILAPYTFKIMHWNAPYIPAISKDWWFTTFQMIWEKLNHFTDWLLIKYYSVQVWSSANYKPIKNWVTDFLDGFQIWFSFLNSFFFRFCFGCFICRLLYITYSNNLILIYFGISKEDCKMMSYIYKNII